MQYRYTLGPGQSKTIDASGDFFCVTYSAVDLEIAPRGWEACTYNQGDKLTLAPGTKFDFLTIRNPTAAPTTVVIFVSLGGRYEQQKFAVIEPKTRVIGAADTLPGLDNILLDPDLFLTGGDIRRKAILVSNPDTSLKLALADLDGNIFLYIQPGDSITVPISEACLLVNPNGAPVEYSLGQIFWTV